jgi:aryl-alcohol dehydrogenase-like predicted oxidoreductase
MQYHRLGNSGSVVSDFCLGTMTFGSEADELASHEIIDAYVSAGGTFIDVANTYVGGKSESIVGSWLRAHPTEARQVVLATKGRFPMGPGPNDQGTSRRHLTRALDDSLHRLGVEQIDLYQLHCWDPVTPLAESLRFLDDAVRAGKISYYGFSNFLGWEITKAVDMAASHHWAPPVTLQPQYNLLMRDIEHEIIPACRDAGIGLLTWSPLAGGWLSGKYQRDVSPTNVTRFGKNPTRGLVPYAAYNAKEQTWNVVDAVTRIAKARGISPAQVSLAWVAAQPAVTSVILGVRNLAQLADNLNAANLKLEDHELDILDSVSAPLVGAYPYGDAAKKQRVRKLEGGRDRG